MKVVVLYRPNSEHGRRVDEYIEDFKSKSVTEKIEVVNIDSRNGSSIASIYDIVQYPAILVTTDDGVLQNAWQGSELPLIDEVRSYSRS
jgi:hypothetical protein